MNPCTAPQKLVQEIQLYGVTLLWRCFCTILSTVAYNLGASHKNHGVAP